MNMDKRFKCAAAVALFAPIGTFVFVYSHKTKNPRPVWEFKQIPEALPLMAWTVEIITFKYVKLILFVQQFFIDL